VSIVTCPQCGKRKSGLAPICDHCGFETGEAGEEDLRRFRKRKLREQIYRLNMASYAVMATAILAFAWYFVASGGFQMPPGTNGPFYLMGIAAIGYLVVRVLLFRARKQKKSIRRGG
jgi:hypothetical protein